MSETSSELNQLERFWEAMFGLAKRCDAQPMNKHSGCWSLQIDDSWFIAVNGHKTPMAAKPNGSEVPPFSCYVEFNGWPAGIIDPGGGCIAAGTAANMETLIEAITHYNS